jgi:hypothetical protein
MAGGRVLQGFQLGAKAAEIVDGFRLRRGAHFQAVGHPVWRHHTHRHRLGAGLRPGLQRGAL